MSWPAIHRFPHPARLLTAVGVTCLAWTAADLSDAATHPDRVWLRADRAAHPVREVAVLPVVNVIDDGRPPAFVEDRVNPYFCDRLSYVWIDPPGARALLVRRTRHPYSELDSLSRQIWRWGHVDSTTASAVAHQLEVQSVLCIRIDRWERLDLRDPHRMRAMVEMEAALVDSSGALLWTVWSDQTAPTSLEEQRDLSEAAGLGGAPAVVVGPTRSSEWGVPALNSYRRWAPDFDQCVSKIFGRWAAAFDVKHR